MSDHRTEIIIKEIKYWKMNKLLPDIYCDFLLALYTKGETKEAKNKEKLASIIYLAIQMFLLLSSVVIINFDGINDMVAMIYLSLSFLIMLWLFKKVNKQNKTHFYLSLTILLVFILLSVMHIVSI